MTERPVRLDRLKPGDRFTFRSGMADYAGRLDRIDEWGYQVVLDNARPARQCWVGSMQVTRCR